MRRVRRFLPLLVLLVVSASVAFVLTARPQIADARRSMERAWDEAAGPLDERYALLTPVVERVGAVPGPTTELAAELDDALTAWRAARTAGGVGAQVEAANRLEAGARRVAAAVSASPRLSADPAVVGAVDAFAGAPPPEQAADFDAAARDYARERSGTLRGVVAGVFGYGPVPTLDVRAST